MRGVVRGVSCAALLGLAAACSPGSRDAPADVILTGGAVYMLDGWAEAVAVRDGVVVAVGDAETTDRLRGSDTRIVDLAGKAVFPGLNDGHAHPGGAARERAQSCRVPRGPWAAVVTTVAACAETMSPGEWIYTGPIGNELLGRETTRQSLDEIAPDNPVILYVIGGHAVVANSRALEAAGIDRSIAAPQGGVIERDSGGEPTGVLREASSLWVHALPPPDPAALASGIGWALDQLVAKGVTSVTDARVNESNLAAYAALADAGRLKLRVRACLLWEPNADVVDSLLAGGYARDHLAPGCVKIFVDGETASGRTAALLEPYQPADGSATDERGALTLSQEILTAAVTRFDHAGLTVKFHAWGDGAVDAALTAIEAAREANGPDGPNHEIGHVMLARSQDILRARDAGAVFEFSPSSWVSAASSIMGKDIGEPRMARAWPVRDALDAGAPAVAGTDWPAGPPSPYNPWVAIATLVTRLNPGAATGQPFAPAERITLQEAIALFTAYPAMHSGQPDAPGIIALGRKADLVVLDRNPFEIAITEVPETTAVMTIVGGDVVHDAAATRAGGG